MSLAMAVSAEAAVELEALAAILGPEDYLGITNGIAYRTSNHTVDNGDGDGDGDRPLLKSNNSGETVVSVVVKPHPGGAHYNRIAVRMDVTLPLGYLTDGDNFSSSQINGEAKEHCERRIQLRHVRLSWHSQHGVGESTNVGDLDGANTMIESTAGMGIQPGVDAAFDEQDATFLSPAEAAVLGFGEAALAFLRDTLGPILAESADFDGNSPILYLLYETLRGELERLNDHAGDGLLGVLVPRDVLKQILFLLEPADLASLACANRFFLYLLDESPEAWRRHTISSFDSGRFKTVTCKNRAYYQAACRPEPGGQQFVASVLARQGTGDEFPLHLDRWDIFFKEEMWTRHGILLERGELLFPVAQPKRATYDTDEQQDLIPSTTRTVVIPAAKHGGSRVLNPAAENDPLAAVVIGRYRFVETALLERESLALDQELESVLLQPSHSSHNIACKTKRQSGHNPSCPFVKETIGLFRWFTFRTMQDVEHISRHVHSAVCAVSRGSVVDVVFKRSDACVRLENIQIGACRLPVWDNPIMLRMLVDLRTESRRHNYCQHVLSELNRAVVGCVRKTRVTNATPSPPVDAQLVQHQPLRRLEPVRWREVSPFSVSLSVMSTLTDRYAVIQYAQVWVTTAFDECRHGVYWTTDEGCSRITMLRSCYSHAFEERRDESGTEPWIFRSSDLHERTGLSYSLLANCLQSAFPHARFVPSALRRLHVYGISALDTDYEGWPIGLS